MSLRIKKNTPTDFAMLFLTIVVFCFKDYNNVTYITQVVVFCIIFISKILTTNFKIKKYKIRYLAYKMAFILWCVISCIWSINKSEVLSLSLTLVIRTMTGFSIIMYADNRDNRNKLIKYMIVAALLLCIRMMICVPLSAWGSERVGNYLSHDISNSYGNTGITYVLGVVCIYLFPDLGIIKKTWVRYTIISILSIFSLLSGSKKQIVILIICIFFTALFSSESPLKTLRNLLIGVAIVAIILIIIFQNKLLYEAVGSRILSFLNFAGFDNVVAADASSIGRGKIIEEAARVFKQHPLYGVGIDNFKYFNQHALIWAENNYLELLADVGIIGCISYYFIYFDCINVIRRNFDRKNPYILLLILLTLCLLIIDFTMVSYASITLQFHLACLFAFSYTKENHLDDNEINIIQRSNEKCKGITKINDFD